MLGKLARLCFLAGAMCGLCAPAFANTTADADNAAKPEVPTVRVSPADQDKTKQEQPTADQDKVKPEKPPARVTLLLPLHSDTFGAAAQAVRAGFQAAHEREPEGITISVLETTEGPQSAVLAYSDAVSQSDIIVGPLARSDVSAVALSGKVSKPTLALALPESIGDEEIGLPQNMLSIGLSAEEEARQVADWVGLGRKAGKAFVISTSLAWQKRAAKAFTVEWQHLGLDAQQIEISSSSGYIGAASLVQMKKRIAEEKPTLLFIALDAAQARQLQLALGKGNIVYGISQLNPLTADDWRTAERRPEMNGVRLVDLPWLIQPDHPAVMIYPKPVVAGDQRANPDLERLYALGIDAYRVAREIANRRNEFDLDGVTGKLSVRLGRAASPGRFQRVEQPAVYQDGVVVPLLR
jgi:hypothetical protein